MKVLLTLLASSIFLWGCYPAEKKGPGVPKNKYVFQETIVKGKDTGMVRLGNFRRVDIADVLCQRWQMEKNEDELPDITEGMPLDIVMFRDSSFVDDPMEEMRIGKWGLTVREKIMVLTLYYNDGLEAEFRIKDISSKELILFRPLATMGFEYTSTGMMHANIRNDPFHPSNNQWRIRPDKKETKEEINHRVKECVRFFALYYRDHIKRDADRIVFLGLPDIFEWYNGGIGLPNKEDLSLSWVQCFYNREQALEGYEILRKLIVDYEYDWPNGTPSWVYRTHSVLEQMYHKL